jgi:hypothetical protein
MSTPEYPREVEAIAEDYMQRRSGLLKALTDGMHGLFMLFLETITETIFLD